MKRREYKSGMKWCVWRWKDICWNGELYLRRLHIFQCPLFAIMLHFIKNYDQQRHQHDHPVNMLCFVLSGEYDEQRGESERSIKRYRVNWIPATCKHRIIGVMTAPPTITLAICGPRKREWGFHTENGWMPWREYHDKYEGSTT